MPARRADAARRTASRSLAVVVFPAAHTPHGGIERRIGSEEIGGTATVKNDPLCIKSVFHGLLEIQYIKG